MERLPLPPPAAASISRLNFGRTLNGVEVRIEGNRARVVASSCPDSLPSRRIPTSPRLSLFVTAQSRPFDDSGRRPFAAQPISMPRKAVCHTLNPAARAEGPTSCRHSSGHVRGHRRLPGKFAKSLIAMPRQPVVNDAR